MGCRCDKDRNNEDYYSERDKRSIVPLNKFETIHKGIFNKL